MFIVKTTYFENNVIPIKECISNQKNLHISPQKIEILGQGTLSGIMNTDKEFDILFLSEPDLEANYQFRLTIGVQKTGFYKYENGTNSLLKALDKSQTSNIDAFIDKNRDQTYWFSIDRENQRLRFGKGYMLKKLVVFEYEFTEKTDIFNHIKYMGFNKIDKKPDSFVYWRYAVVQDIAPIIISRQQITLDTLDKNDATIVDDLSNECRYLYSNIVGPNVRLNTDDFPDFASAINYSIVTPGKLCFKKLQEKVGEFGPPAKPLETYLRVTVGVNRVNSPGIPFVLEIWPGGHYSPIHNHSNANAIIKVLHGSLTCQWFRSLSQFENKPYDTLVLGAGQVTWLNDRQFQTHRLYNHNISGNMCATIQCYMYNSTDNLHYEYFDYLSHNGQKNQYTPQSDWDYLSFKQLIREEWESYKQNLPSIDI